MLEEFQLTLSMNYEWLRAFHIMAVIAWMAGLFYLPRLFVYHVSAEKGSDKSETFKVMERKLLKFIMNPASIVSWIFGGLMIWANPGMFSEGWFHVKLTGVIFMTGFHHFLAKNVRVFAADENEFSERFFRIINEIPTILMIIIVIAAVVQPF